MMDEKEAMLTKKKKRKIEKEHDPVGTEKVIIKVAVVLLVIMAATLLFLIFYKKDSALKVPDKPDYKEIEMSVIDFTRDNINTTVLESSEKTEVPVKYTNVTDFYNDGVYLSNPTVEYMNERFIVRGREYSKSAFVSSIKLDGKYEWSVVLDDEQYETSYINSVLYNDGFYYVFLTRNGKSINSLEMYKIDEKGKIKGEKILSNSSMSIQSVELKKGKFYIVAADYYDLAILQIDTKMKKVEEKYMLSKEKTFNVDKYILVKLAYYDNDSMNVVLQNGKKFIMLSLDDNGVAKKDDMVNLNKIGEANDTTLSAYHDGLVVHSGKKIYKLDKKFETVNINDYSLLKLSDIDKFKDNENLADMPENELFIQTAKVVNNFILTHSSTYFSNVYDVYDKHLALKKRYTFDFVNYDYKDVVFLTAFYLNDKLYEVYTIGMETPSIMISMLG